MNNLPARPVAAFMLTSHAACAASGLLLGDLVLALSARDPGSLAGLLTALVMSLCGGASVVLLLGHLHGAARWRGARPMPMPLQSWLLCLSAGALAAMGLNAAL